MAISPFKTFIAGEVLTASDLNASFTTITNAGLALIAPLTEAIDFDGQRLILDSDADTSITASTDDQIDFELLGADYFRMLLTGGIADFRSISYDAGAAAGPYISLVRDSASPLADDDLGALRFLGENDAGEETVYGRVRGEISVTTDGAENGRVVIDLMRLGSLFEFMKIGAGDTFAINSDAAAATANPKFQLTRNSISPDDADIVGQIDFRAANSAAEITSFGSIEGVLDDVTDGEEDGGLRIHAILAGVDTIVAKFGAGGVSIGAPTGGTPLTAGTLNAQALQVNGAALGLVAGQQAAQNLASETSVLFTGISEFAQRITIMFNEASLDGTDDWLVQIGPAGGVETSGYVSSSGTVPNAANPGVVNSTAGFVMRGANAASLLSGPMVLTRVSGTNTWIEGHTGKILTTAGVAGGGSKTTASNIDRLAVTRSGTNTMDAGSVSILVE